MGSKNTNQPIYTHTYPSTYNIHNSPGIEAAEHPLDFPNSDVDGATFGDPVQCLVSGLAVMADFELCRLNQDVWPGLRGWQTAEGKDRNLAGRLLLFELSCNPWQSCYSMSGQRS